MMLSQFQAYYNYECVEDGKSTFYTNRKEIAIKYNVHINTVSNRIKHLMNGSKTPARSIPHVIIKKCCVPKSKYIMLD